MSSPPDNDLQPGRPDQARILVVDDEPAVRRALTRGLERRGFRVSSADGRMALAAAALDAPDLILLDVQLPDAKGPTLYLRLVARWPHLRRRVILMSSRPYLTGTDIPAEVSSLQLLPKPFDLDMLYDLVDQVLHEPAGP